MPRLHSASTFALSILLLTSAVEAADFTPNSFNDFPDASPGDGNCASTEAGATCTLRAAIMEANALGGSDTIHVSGGTYTLSIAGVHEDAAATGDLDINDDLAIISTAGILTTIDGGGLDRVMDVTGSSGLLISGLVIRNGAALSPDFMQDTYLGGGIRLGTSGSTIIQFCAIEDNAANAGGGLYVGAGGSALVRYSVLRRNESRNDVGVTNPEGSAIRVSGATLRLENDSLYGNAGIGGGSGNRGTISSHTGSLQFFSTTIDGDSESGISAFNGDTVLQNVTLSSNGFVGLSWSSNSSAAETLFVRNSIISGNDIDCVINPNGGDSIDVAGHNIDSDNSCGFDAGAGPAAGNLWGIPLEFTLGPLREDLPLPARFPGEGSPAVGAGSALDPTSGLPDACFQFDQRGVDRSTTLPCDIGAVEAIYLFRNGFEDIVV